MNRKKLLLTTIAVLLVLAMAVPGAMSYFTTYVRAAGYRTLHLSDQTEFGETENEGGGKHVVITAAEGSDPVFVRVLIMAPDAVLGSLEVKNGGASGSWENKGDFTADGCLGYWYFSEPIAHGQKAEMDIDLPEGFKYDGETFNVVVVHEYVPAQVGADGELYADWENTDLIVDNGEDSGEGGSTGGDAPVEGGDGQ